VKFYNQPKNCPTAKTGIARQLTNCLHFVRGDNGENGEETGVKKADD
jgi:hypothetical protein